MCFKKWPTQGEGSPAVLTFARISPSRLSITVFLNCDFQFEGLEYFVNRRDAAETSGEEFRDCRVRDLCESCEFRFRDVLLAHCGCGL
jgi:hypothetical protein